MKVTIRVKQIKNEQRPDLPFEWDARSKAASAGSCCATFEEATKAATEWASEELIIRHRIGE